MPGPVPKRSTQRRRRNTPTVPIDSAAGAPKVAVPPAKRDWHPIARRWYESLAPSGQSGYYEPSDWATAFVIAESLSRDLKPKVVGITETGRVIKASQPLNGASLTAYLRAMSVLMVTEGDRRRLHLELQRDAGEGDEDGADVSELAEYRRRLQSG